MIHSIQYVSGGLFISEGEWIHPNRTIDTDELIFVQRGSVFLQENDIRYRIDPGYCFFLQKGLNHSGWQKSSDVSFYWVHFTGELPPNYFPKLFLPQENHRIELLLKELLHYDNTPVYPKACCDYIIRLLLIECSVQASPILEGNALISSVCEWIRDHSDQPLTASAVSRHFRYNEDYLSRLFRQNNLGGLKQYINNARMYRIKTLLLSSEYSLQEISEKTGFEDYKHFLKFFKYHQNTTPSQFRAIYFNTHINHR